MNKRLLSSLLLAFLGSVSYAEHAYGPGLSTGRAPAFPQPGSLSTARSACDVDRFLPPSLPPAPQPPPPPAPVTPPPPVFPPQPTVPAPAPTVPEPAPTVVPPPAPTATTVPAPPRDEAQAAWEGLVKHHNQVRAEVGSPPLRWSDRLAKQAKEWADKCDFSHNPDLGKTRSGQNIYASSDVRESITEAARVASQMWADEKRDFDAANNTCASGKICGHYTQMAWKSTTEVGCAVAACPTTIRNFEAGVIVVCDYSPAGNVVGQRPF